ncbi:hypothetical protein L6R50_26935 [Myxococcota bacterium]|nr:hypothetical protein [Myxococcota bacterium]
MSPPSREPDVPTSSQVPAVDGAAAAATPAPDEVLESAAAIPEQYRYLPDVPRGLAGPAADVAQILSAVVRTSRSFLFYAPNNRALQLFMEDLESQLGAFLSRHGSLDLGVEATRFLWGEAVVHEDSDRERSLPFKLFRDGVRGLRIREGVTQAEIATLLRILSVRLVGVHRHDEDLVTQLWRADLEHIRHDVVEGFTHEIYGRAASEGDEADAGAAVPRIMDRLRSAGAPPTPSPRAGEGRGGTGASPVVFQVLGEEADEAPGNTSAAEAAETFAHARYPGLAHYDLPVPLGIVEIAGAPLTDEDRARVRAEIERDDREGHVRLLDALFALSVAHPDLLPAAEVARAAVGARRAIVREERLADLVDVLAYLTRVAEGGVYAEVSEEVARLALPEYAEPMAVRDVATLGARFGEGAQVARYLQLIGDRASAEALLPLLDFNMPDGVLDAILGTLHGRTSGDVRWYAKRLEDAGDVAARALMRGLLGVGTAEAVDELCHQSRHPEAARRFFAADLLGRVPESPAVCPALVALLVDPSPGVRTRAMEILWERPGRGAFDAFRLWWDTVGAGEVSEEEQPRVLRLAARLGGDGSLPFLRGLVRPPSAWKLTNPRDEGRSRAAAEAIAFVATEGAEDALRAFKDVGTAEWRRFALRCLVRAHRARTGGTP